MLAYPAESCPDAISTAMQQIIVDYHSFGGHFRHLMRREAVAIPVRVSPLSFEFEPEGESFRAVTHHVSCCEIRFLHTCEISSPFVRIVISSDEELIQKQFVGSIERCKPCDEFMMIACQILAVSEGAVDEFDCG
ncbi:MAG: hypothetical protein GY768_19985 [Planctomycetaceae bacterium]|nr:hypothetical protein [Planctomycetaceae bacterium]